jgi:hypothetical protein
MWPAIFVAIIVRYVFKLSAAKLKLEHEVARYVVAANLDEARSRARISVARWN